MSSILRQAPLGAASRSSSFAPARATEFVSGNGHPEPPRMSNGNLEPDDDAGPVAAAAGMHEATVSDAQAGTRLDRFLTDKLALSRARVQSLIREGQVEGPNGAVTDPGGKVRAGQLWRVTVPPPEPAGPAAEKLPLAVVYEDRHLIVIDKPAGLVVHPAAGHAGGTLVNALIAHCGAELSGIGGVKRPGIVHRLDKETSGLLVVAKTDAAHQGLAAQFAAHGIDGRLVRTYEAFVWGVPKRASGTVTANLGRSRTNRTRMAVMREPEGRHAATHFEVVETFSDAEGKPLAARLSLALETGRTHQIRVHLAHIGHPVMGDPVYGTGFKSMRNRLSDEAGTALEQLGRQALHARELGFEHPVTQKPMHFTSPRPDDMEVLYRTLRAAPPAPQKRGKGRISKR